MLTIISGRAFVLHEFIQHNKRVNVPGDNHILRLTFNACSFSVKKPIEIFKLANDSLITPL